jgi:hypothetical protein
VNETDVKFVFHFLRIILLIRQRGSMQGLTSYINLVADLLIVDHVISNSI